MQTSLTVVRGVQGKKPGMGMRGQAAHSGEGGSTDLRSKHSDRRSQRGRVREASPGPGLPPHAVLPAPAQVCASETTTTGASLTLGKTTLRAVKALPGRSQQAVELGLTPGKSSDTRKQPAATSPAPHQRPLHGHVFCAPGQTLVAQFFLQFNMVLLLPKHRVAVI